MDGKHNVLALVCVALLATGVSASHPDSSGWEDVFNADLFNAECSKPGWSWKSDGYLVPETSETLFSRKDYTNFVLDVAYVAEPTANSGVFLYDTSHPKYKFEVQILDDLDPKYSIIADSFNCTEGMVKGRNSVLQLLIQYHTVGNNNNR